MKAISFAGIVLNLVVLLIILRLQLKTAKYQTASFNALHQTNRELMGAYNSLQAEYNQLERRVAILEGGEYL